MRRLVPLVVAVGVAGLLLWRGRVVPAAVLLVLAAVLVLVPAIGRPVDRAVRRATSMFSHWLGLLLFGIVDVFLVTPVWAVGRVLRRDTLGQRRVTASGSGFEQPVSDDGLDGRLFGRERPALAGGRPRRALRAVPQLVGVVILLVALDFGAGYAWDRAWGHPEGASAPAPVNADPIRIVATPQRREREVKIVPDARANLPSMRNVPWWKDYLRELQLVPSVFYPYLLNKPLPFNGRFIHIDDDWARRSYEPAIPTNRAAPTIWFFGGSTGFGEGQRDEHTISSEVARLAEADGIPVRVVNYGQRGWVNWQEMLLYEQLLAGHPPPTEAVFYDGLNDTLVQVQKPLGQPSFYDLDKLARKATGRGVDQGNQPTPASPTEEESPGDAFSVLWHDYRRHSFVSKVVGKLQDELGLGRADAAPLPSDAPGQACYYNHRTDKPEDCADQAVAVKGTLTVYRRGRAMILDMSKRHGVDPVLFWQPIPGHQPYYQEIRSKLDAPTVDIAGSLDDHQDVYLGDGHTDEDGARLVAEAEWKTLKPRIEAWYRAHPPGG